MSKQNDQPEAEASKSSHSRIHDSARGRSPESTLLACEVDRKGILRKLSPPDISLAGVYKQTKVGNRFLDLIHPADRTATALSFAKVIQGRPSGGFHSRIGESEENPLHVEWTTRWDSVRQMMYAEAKPSSVDNRPASARSKCNF